MVRHEAIAGVVPLEVQFPAPDGPLELPQGLQLALFGTSDTPTSCYCVLDAGQIPNLAETLARSGLEHKCLFSGQLAEELSEVSPWLVRLDAAKRFTHDLFTASDAPWHLWGKSRFIILRSGAGFHDLWKHFRGVTRIKDARGKGYYFRFWEPAYFGAVLKQGSPEEACRLAPPQLITEALMPKKGSLEIIALAAMSTPRPTAEFILSDPLRDVFSEVALSLFYEQMEVSFCASGRMSAELFTDCLQDALRAGFRAKDVLEALMDWCAEQKVNLLQQPWARASLSASTGFEDVSRLGQLRRASRRLLPNG